ncbi:MAG: hypothetical protein WCF36_05440 [Candidatus Nanopelagicales bacterium]
MGNLAAVAALLTGMLGARRGSVRAFQVWVGSLLYLTYAFVIYAMSVHFGSLFLPYVAVLGLSAYSALFGLLAWSGRAVVPARARTLGVGVISLIAVDFALLWLGSIAGALAAGRPPTELTEAGLTANPVHVLDLALVLPGMLIVAMRAHTRKPGGEQLLAPWLVFAALMGASIVAAMLFAAAAPGPLLMLALITVLSAVTATIVLTATTTAPSSPLS